MKRRKVHDKTLKVKDNYRAWIDEINQIQNMFVYNFTTCFKLTQNNATNIEIDVPKVAMKDDNKTLFKPIEDKEIE